MAWLVLNLLFTDYLFNRCKKVKHDNFLSAEEKVFSGVPQGSIIGPLLFVLFYNDFPNCLKHSKCVIYADDTVIYVPGKDIFIIESRLSDDMNRIANWCTKNELILNLKRGKTEAMLWNIQKVSYPTRKSQCDFFLQKCIFHHVIQIHGN